MSNILFPAGHIVKTQLLDTEYINPFAEGWDMEFYHVSKLQKLFTNINAFHTPHIQLSTTHYSSSLMMRGTIPVKSIVISYIHTDGLVNFQNQKMERDELIILTYNDEIDMLVSEKSISFTLAIEEQFFHSTFLKYFGTHFESLKNRKKIILADNRIKDFISLFKYWLNLFLHTDIEKNKNIDYGKIENEIINSLFGFIAMKPYKLKRQPEKLKLARDILYENIDHNFNISDLVKELQIPQRTLEHMFKQNFSISPKSYFQLLRLNAVRKELLAHNTQSIKISDIALKYNFFHLGHFASEYKKLYGESPSVTLKK